jgi:hypothetical protein
MGACNGQVRAGWGRLAKSEIDGAWARSGMLTAHCTALHYLPCPQEQTITWRDLAAGAR